MRSHTLIKSFNLVALSFFILFIACKKDSGPATFLVSIDSQDGGTVSTSGGEYEEGSTLTIEAVPDQGFDFAGWTGGASGDTNPLTITVGTNANITATFVRSKYNLTVTVDGQGTVAQELISTAKTPTEYESFSNVRLTATPSSNWIFYKWSGASSLTTPQIEVEMDSSKDITASFQEIFLQLTQDDVNFVVGKWKIRKKGSQTVASKSALECEITEVIFRSNGTFTFSWADGEQTTGTYNLEEQQDNVFFIFLFVGETQYGTIEDLVVTNNYISFAIVSSDCSDNIEGDKDDDYDESEDPLANCSITSTLESGPESQTVSVSTSIATVTHSFSATCSFSLSASVSNLPQGVTMNFSDNQAVISGSPTQAGTFDYVITVIDTISTTTSANGSIIVEAGADNTAPTISLSGDQTITLTVGDTYTEPGATAIDDVDGMIQVVISGSVDTSTVGNYTITYTATDSSGNSVSVTRTVQVVAGQTTGSSDIYFENGTCKCPNASVGDTAVINGVTYTVVDDSTIAAQIANENYNLCTTKVTNMNELFKDKTSFNSDIGFWDTSNVTNMNGMFTLSAEFNQDISSWNTSSVVQTGHMFDGASSFNQDIGSWNISNVVSIRYMFANSNFNQDIGRWDTSKVNDMQGMFYNAKVFNQNIGNWNTSNVTVLQHMFLFAESFNQPIGNWDVSSVTNMNSMFGGATNFNQDLTNWCVSNFQSEPDDEFSGGSALTEDNKPVWGTCPNTYTINVTASNATDYTLSGSDRSGNISGSDPAIVINRGDKITFNVNAAGHPFYIKTVQGTGTDNLVSGVTGNGADNGAVTFRFTTAGTYYYQCSLHNGMYGTITVQ
ncbi:MAG: BspA family leucine-rich repeat surface protein [Flavobacteriaceae bacterium]|nr:BspA family leucine-rich repeat surface protein [Flavobacteriaceae bacterium]